MELAGQILGWAAALLMFISYQCKEHKSLLVVQTASSLCICASYCLLGAWSGMLLNIVCILRNLIIYKKNMKIFSYSFMAASIPSSEIIFNPSISELSSKYFNKIGY